MKKKNLFLGLSLAALGAFGISAIAACGGTPNKPGPDGSDGETHTHNLEKHDEVEAQCNAAGTKEYWSCTKGDDPCNKLFSDAAGEHEISAPEAIEATGQHHLVYKYLGDNHWQECEWCGEEKTGEETHEAAGDMVYLVDSQPTKHDYFVGELFNKAGLKIVKECYAACGYSVDITDDCIIENENEPLTAGMTSITATYGDENITIPITVNEIVCTSISAQLKSNVTYYNNGLAIPKASDFEVTASYNDGSSRTLTESEYTVNAATGFDTNGGLITISLVGVNNVKDEINYTLVDVVLETVTVKTNPANMTYRTDEVISLEGLVLLATYTDGTTQDITEGFTSDASSDPYTTEGEVTVTVSYGGKNVELTFVISDDDGDVTSIVFAEGVTYCTVYSGAALNTATVPAVYAVYESGRKLPLEDTEYSISLPSGTAALGTKYTVTATLTEDNSKTVTLPVKVLTKINGNQFTDMAGGATNTKSEKEYIVEADGTTITESTRVVPYVGGFSKVAEAGGDAHVTWTVPSTSSVAAEITFRAANSYLKKVDGGYQMDALQVNSVADLFVNGEKVNIPDSVVLRGTPVSATYPPVYNIYYTFTIDGLILAKGDNQIKLVWKNSTLGQKNHWNETPSTMNIDYIEVATLGAEGDGTAAGATIQSMIVWHDGTNFDYGDDIQSYKDKITALAVMSDGSRKLLTDSDVTLTVTGDQTKRWFVGGEYTFTVTLNSDNSVAESWSKNIVKPDDRPLEAYGASLKVDGGKVYFILVMHYIGTEDYTTQASIFSMSNDAADKADGKFQTADKVEQDATKIYIYFDVTDTEKGEIYVHLKIDGKGYDNGEGKTNGDFKQTAVKNDNKWTYPTAFVYSGSGTKLNGKTYSLATQWNMVKLTIA